MSAAITAVTLSNRTLRVLGLVRALIEYGKQLATTLQQRTHATDLSEVTQHFGTIDIGQILARITRGLLRAAALEARLVSRPIRRRPSRATRSAASPRQPRAARPAEQTTDAANIRTPQSSAPSDIAAEIRHHPAGAILVDICRELGIVPSHSLWRELSHAIVENGGSLVTLFKDACKRLGLWPTYPPATARPAGSPPHPPAAKARGTGPP
jgi:hypothetical protein